MRRILILQYRFQMVMIMIILTRKGSLVKALDSRRSYSTYDELQN